MLLNSSLTWTIESSINGIHLLFFSLIVFLIIGLISIVLYKYFSVKKKIRNTRVEMIESFDVDRATLSRELHDVVGSFLIPLKSTSERMEPLEKAKWDERILTFERFIQQTSKTIYPEYIYDGDLSQALNKLSSFLSTDSTKIMVHVTEAIILPKTIESQCFKLILELLSNVIKHDKPKNIVLVSLNQNNKALFTLNYSTESTEHPFVEPNDKSLGLRIIEQRLILVNGTISRTYDTGDHQIKLSVPFKK